MIAAAWALGFFLWHFILRRLGIRLPTRSSARLYAALVLASFALRGRSTFALAAAVLLLVGRRRPRGTREHFDALAPDYAEQLSPAARERVVGRKTDLTCHALAAAGLGRAHLLDIGCGHGWYVGAHEARGHRVTGVDVAIAQLRAARSHLRGHSRLAAGSILQLPVSAGSFHAAYSVNVLHHLECEQSQAAALGEMARAVRPGGVVLLHEINTRNPLFAFYMSYVFPLWKRIDVGTERWLDPTRLPVATDLTLETVRFYTYLPDFTPAPLYRTLIPLERWLERSRARGWSAHFTAVYRKVGGCRSAAGRLVVCDEERRREVGDGPVVGREPIVEEAHRDRHAPIPPQNAADAAQIDGYPSRD
jgi:SAM-dependent methyltransferase